MDFTTLAAGVVATLCPYIAVLAEKSVAAIGEKVPAAAESLFRYLKGKFKSHPSAEDALEDLSKAPTDSDRQAVLRRQLVKLMEQDGSFAESLSNMLSESISNTTNIVSAGENSKIVQQVGKANTANIG